MKINMQKTKITFNSLAREQEFRIPCHSLESVKEYVYLDQLLTGDPDHEKEMYRIKLGWSAYGRHYEILTGSLPLSFKRKVYNHCILPVLTYGAETWRLTKKLENKLRTAQRAMERKMLGLT